MLLSLVLAKHNNFIIVFLFFIAVFNNLFTIPAYNENVRLKPGLDNPASAQITSSCR